MRTITFLKQFKCCCRFVFFFFFFRGNMNCMGKCVFSLRFRCSAKTKRKKKQVTCFYIFTSHSERLSSTTRVSHSFEWAQWKAFRASVCVCVCFSFSTSASSLLSLNLDTSHFFFDGDFHTYTTDVSLFLCSFGDFPEKIFFHCCSF